MVRGPLGDGGHFSIRGAMGRGVAAELAEESEVSQDVEVA
jgi:hypothetical protein